MYSMISVVVLPLSDFIVQCGETLIQSVLTIDFHELMLKTLITLGGGREKWAKTG